MDCNAENVDIVDGLCLDCFLRGKKLVEMPHHVDLPKCINCGEYLIRNQWTKNAEDEAITNIVFAAVKVIPTAKLIKSKSTVEKQDDRTFATTIRTDVDIRGSIKSDESSTIVRLKNSVCQRCSRQLGNYYEATIQIRSGKRKFCKDLCDKAVTWTKNKVKILSKANQQLFISKIQHVPGGVDICLSSASLGKSLARKIADIYNAEIKESASLIGSTSDGREVHRTTFLVRMPIYRIGDIIFYNGRTCKLNSIGRIGIQATDIFNFHKFFIKKSILPTVKVIAEAEDVTEAIVVSVSDREIQILHPRDNSTLDVRIPQNSRIGVKVNVVEIKGNLFYVP